MTGRTFIIDPAVQGRVSVVTAAAAVDAANISNCSSRRCAPTASSRCRSAGGALPHPADRRRGGDRAGRRRPAQRRAASSPRFSASAISSRRRRSRRCGRWSAATARSPPAAARSSSPTSPTISRASARCWPGSTSTASATRVVGLHNAGAREIAAALAELAPEGVSVVPVDSSNAIAFRGDAAAVAQLIADRRGARPARRQRQRDPGRLPPACRRRAIAAGAAAAARPGADPAGRAPPRRGAAAPRAAQRRRRRRRRPQPSRRRRRQRPPPRAAAAARRPAARAARS